jgi:hypothetical protein
LQHVGQHHLRQGRAFGGTGLIARQRQPHERPVGRTGVDLDVAEPEPALGDAAPDQAHLLLAFQRDGLHQGRWPSSRAGALVLNPFSRTGSHGA